MNGGPSGSIPPKPPKRGGAGYSFDDKERRLEWEYDQAVLKLEADPAATLGDAQARARALQEHREQLGVTGRLDERAGRMFNDDERLVVDTLLAEGRNISSLTESKVPRRRLPDMFVDAELAEIKTSNKSSARAFGLRIAAVQSEQYASHTYVNAMRSGITREDLEATLQEIVDNGNARYIRVIGADYDTELGRW